ncbi:MAG TPA: hypothetical protein VEC36_10150 [Patescibacteria group bacterium]|nr:hypothetical protein [Patescibacteria group bacterium]
MNPYIYKNASQGDDAAKQEYMRLADEILNKSTAGKSLSAHPELLAKLSAISTLQDMTEDLYPALSEIFAFLLSADADSTQISQVQGNG